MWIIAGSYSGTLPRVKVGFDVTPLVRPTPRGVVRVTWGLVEALERRSNLEVVRLAPPDGANLNAWRRGAIPRQVREHGLDGVHSMFSAFAVRAPCRRVQTIHELPWLAGVKENAGIVHRAWARIGPAFADAVVCPTEHVAARARRYAWLGGAKVRAIPWGVDPAFAPLPPPGAVDEVLLDRHRLGEIPFALCLGATRAKKDLAAALRGLAELERELRLVVTGAETADLRRDLGLAARLGIAGRVLVLGEVDEADLPGLVRLATAVCVLSRSEGFGLPALEALASGTPAIVARGSAQAEVAGGAGFAVDPGDPAAVAAALARALDERGALRFELPARAARFTWDACAEAVEELWASLG
jgi:glycosyltransferase involved in cell wall biosynthesis